MTILEINVIERESVHMVIIRYVNGIKVQKKELKNYTISNEIINRVLNENVEKEIPQKQNKQQPTA